MMLVSSLRAFLKCRNFAFNRPLSPDGLSCLLTMPRPFSITWWLRWWTFFPSKKFSNWNWSIRALGVTYEYNWQSYFWWKCLLLIPPFSGALISQKFCESWEWTRESSPIVSSGSMDGDHWSKGKQKRGSWRKKLSDELLECWVHKRLWYS